MTCKHCGSEIKDGMDYCMECGESVEDKLIVMSVNELPVDARPLINLGGYIKELVSNMYVLLTFLGALCMYLSVFMKWTCGNVHGKIKGGDLFDMVSENSSFYIGDKKIFYYALIILLMGVAILLYSGRRNIRFLARVENNKLAGIVPIVVSLVAFMMVITNKAYSEARSINHVTIYTCTGIIIYVIGLILSIAGVLLEKGQELK